MHELNFRQTTNLFSAFIILHSGQEFTLNLTKRILAIYPILLFEVA